MAKKKRTKTSELEKAKKRLILSAKNYHAVREFHDYKINMAKLQKKNAELLEENKKLRELLK